MLMRSRSSKCLMLAAIACTVALILLWNNGSKDTTKTSIENQQKPSDNSEEAQQKPATELDSPVAKKLLEMCPHYKEFRNVNFLKPTLRRTLCHNAKAYKLMSDGYPMCVLPNPFNHELISIPKDNSDIIDFQLAASNSTVKLFVFKGNEHTSTVYRRDRRYWESDQIRWLVRFALKFMPQVTFLDIGSNLGAYTLEAAKLGLPVVSLEANIRNILRVHLSLDASRLKADMVWNFISQDHELKYMTFPEVCTQSFASGIVQMGVSDTVPIMPIGADKLRSLIKTKYVVMKVDIEGGESDFLKTSTRLFSEFNVAAVQIEWNPEFVRGFDTRYMRKFFSDRGYRSWRIPGFSSLDFNNIASLGSIEILWVHEKFLDKM